MVKRLNTTVAGLATALSLVLCAGCGSGGPSTTAGEAARATDTGARTGTTTSAGESSEAATPGASQVVARVGTVAVTRGQVNHWMGTLAGQDYYDVSHQQTVPDGLVSDPPNVGRCAASLEAAVAAGRASGESPESGSALLAKCRQLAEALKLQATAFLTATQLAIGFAEEEGARATEGEVKQSLDATVMREYGSEAKYDRYLAARRTSLSDALLEARLALLGRKVLAKLDTPVGRTHYAQGLERWVTRVSCKPGYVVENCLQYKGEKASGGHTLPPAVLMEQVSALVTGKCANKAACAKQAGPG